LRYPRWGGFLSNSEEWHVRPTSTARDVSPQNIVQATIKKQQKEPAREERQLPFLRQLCYLENFFYTNSKTFLPLPVAG
jgi:hypothetical protein